MRRPVDDPERSAAPPTLLYLIKQLELAVRARLDEVLRPVEVTPTQYTALTVLSRRSGLTAAELARNAFVTAQSAAGLIGSLETRGLISRSPDPADRRRLVIRLTTGGRELLDRVEDEVVAVERQLLSALTPAEGQALRRYVNLCRNALADRTPH